MKFKKIERLHVYFLIGVALLVSLVLFLHFRNNEMNKEELAFVESAFFEDEFSIDEEKEANPSPTTIVIDIKGAVTTPGLYELPEGSRMFDAIEKAGGFQEEADELQLNLAQLLHDEMMVYVPIEGEEAHQPATSHAAAQSDKVAINRADAQALEQLPGIGPAKAQAILSYRDEHGPFKSEEDLLNVSGIGPKSLEKLRDHISLP